MVERHLPKVNVAGSSPVFRSNRGKPLWLAALFYQQITNNVFIDRYFNKSTAGDIGDRFSSHRYARIVSPKSAVILTVMSLISF